MYVYIYIYMRISCFQELVSLATEISNIMSAVVLIQQMHGGASLFKSEHLTKRLFRVC